MSAGYLLSLTNLLRVRRLQRERGLKDLVRILTIRRTKRSVTGVGGRPTWPQSAERLSVRMVESSEQVDLDEADMRIKAHS